MYTRVSGNVFIQERVVRYSSKGGGVVKYLIQGESGGKIFIQEGVVRYSYKEGGGVVRYLSKREW